jgi:hypothetical protein
MRTSPRRLSLALALVVVVGSAACASSCVPPPANLTPAAATSFDKQRVQRALDIIRDTAQDGNAQTPPAFSTVATRAVTKWHTAALKTLWAGPGWQDTVKTGLDELLTNLPAHEKSVLAPYVALAKTVITEVAP